MIEFLYTVDVAMFSFLNSGLANPVGDFLWPYITDYDRYLPVRILLVVVWLLLMVKGGKRGRTAALLVVVVLVCADQLSSFGIKPLLERPRPCHTVNGVQVVQNVHLLVHCGGGKSFPSSHAVNNFAVATLFTFFYRRWAWAFFAWAGLVALSRVTVGVHYPSDILGGAIIGMAVAGLIIWLWSLAGRSFASWLLLEPEKETPDG
ncbi:MAG: Membrane-associated phospholipid phosphatase [Bacteroidetes bacterium]|jgi:undecaprenyl-diphosphatase|nr:Membrane-associated phospholipid phosphatase [Bacteroidota bacterium]